MSRAIAAMPASWSAVRLVKYRETIGQTIESETLVLHVLHQSLGHRSVGVTPSAARRPPGLSSPRSSAWRYRTVRRHRRVREITFGATARDPLREVTMDVEEGTISVDGHRVWYRCVG